MGRAGVIAQPLYAQVRDRLLERIVRKEWQHGQVLPNEFDLAREFGVSIGTIRKAVEGLEAARIVTRKQGRGTFVSRDSTIASTEAVSILYGLSPEVQEVATETLVNEIRVGHPLGSTALSLTATQAVIEITRRRTFANGVRALDRIALPQHVFFDFDCAAELPCNLYEYFADYFGIRIANSTEQLSIALATSETAHALGVAPATAVLRIERTSRSVSGEAIEWRETFCFLPKGVGFSGIV